MSASRKLIGVELLERVTALGIKLGLSDNELKAFVDQTCKREEDEVKLQSDAERVERRETREARARELEMQREIEEIKLRSAQATLAATAAVDGEIHGGDDRSSHEEAASSVKNIGPKLPYFEDGKDQIDSYLRRFERYAELQHWPPVDWALYLSALLKGKALEVYSRLADEDAHDYDKLKEALLRKYQLTSEGFRKLFYSSKREKCETAAQFVCRLVSYIDRWIQLAKIEQTFDDLKALFVKEQFLASSDQHLSLYIKERAPRDLNELVCLADQYLDARFNGNVGAGGAERREDSQNREANLNCKGSQSMRHANDSRKEGSSNTSDRVCYSCGKTGHIQRFCRLNSGNRTSERPTRSNYCAIRKDKELSRVMDDQHGAFTNGMGSILQPIRVQCGELPVAVGRVNDRYATVLRDTGCDAVIVRRGLIVDGQYNGRTRRYRTVDGSIGSAPVANVYVESPFYVGRTEVVCMEEPMCDIIIGNVRGLLKPDNDDDKSQVAEEIRSSSVSTRSMEAKRHLTIPKLTVPDAVGEQISAEEFKALQEQDVRECLSLVGKMLCPRMFWSEVFYIAFTKFNVEL